MYVCSISTASTMSTDLNFLESLSPSEAQCLTDNIVQVHSDSVTSCIVTNSASVDVRFASGICAYMHVCVCVFLLPLEHT